MEIGDECIHHTKPVSRQDKQAYPALKWLQMGRFTGLLRTSKIQQITGRLHGDEPKIVLELDHILHQTRDAALLVLYGAEVWIPLSQLDYADIGEGVAWVAKWFADKEGLA